MLYLHGPGEVEYPTSDGEPMGETDRHRQLMMDLIEAIQAYYQQGTDDVYVSGNLLMYYEEGLPSSVLSPDVLVALGLVDRPREIYKVWEEGKAPDLVIEVTSKSTRMRDVGVKKGVYSALGVREFLLFDPFAEYLKPRFQVYRLEQGEFLRVVIPESGYVSVSTGLVFRVVEDSLRVFEPGGERMLENRKELTARVRAMEAQADAVAARADAAEARAERLEAELRALRGADS